MKNEHEHEFNPLSKGIEVGRNTIWHLFNPKKDDVNCEKCKDKCRKKLFCGRVLDKKKV